jgi:hypothetical protein
LPDELHGELAKRFTGTVEWQGEVDEAKLDEKEGLHKLKIKFPVPSVAPKDFTFPDTVSLEIPFSRSPKEKSPVKGSQFAFTGLLKKAKADDLFQPVDVWYGLGPESGKNVVIVSLTAVEPLNSSSAPPVAPAPEKRSEQKPAPAYKFPHGWEHGYSILEKLYWGSPAMLPVLNGWSGIVDEGNEKKSLVMFPLGAVDVNPPTRERIMDARGKPEREAKLQYPSEVKVLDGVVLLSKPKFQLHCLWYGSIGFCFMSPDKAEENCFAVVFDPNKDKP